MSAVSALSEQEQRIKNIFGEATYNPNGIYVATMRVDGVIQEVLFDDYVPVSKEGKPLFCQPNKNEIWVPLLEKAWAKANGSYAKIISKDGTMQLARRARYSGRLPLPQHRVC